MTICSSARARKPVPEVGPAALRRRVALVGAPLGVDPRLRVGRLLR